MFDCAVIGATGYTGIELCKILYSHPKANIAALTTRRKNIIPLRTLLPSLPKTANLDITPFSFNEIKKKADIIFLCLPHTEAMEMANKFRGIGKIVIDLSADFRIKDKSIYKKWYGVTHRFQKRISEAVYGLPELYRKEIRGADLIANPGCYPTGAILAIAPFLKKNLVSSESIIINAASGVSVAGRKLTSASQFCQVDGDFRAYKVNSHQHTPEIEQILSEVSDETIKVTFIPHLLPVSRGILSTVYLEKDKKIKPEKIRKELARTYKNEPFVRVKPEGEYPSLKDVRNTNFCDLGVSVNSKTGHVVVIAAIDNLVKGAAGQAVQNMNIRLGFREEAGLI